MAAKTQAGLENLFQELDTHIHEGDYSKAIKICDKIMSQAPGDEDAMRCKVVSMLKNGQYTESITTISNYSKKYPSIDFSFEKAFAYYRNKNMDEAMKILAAIPSPKSARVQELEAQVFFRKEEYEKCVGIYESLSSNNTVNSAELRSNLCAAYTESGKFKEAKALAAKYKGDVKETYEISFNLACGLIREGKYKEALQTLSTSEEVCRTALATDGFTEEEIKQEVAAVQIQQAYCHQLLGSSSKASSLYEEAIKSKGADANAVAVANNNLVVLHKNHDVFDSLKRLKSAAGSDPSSSSSASASSSSTTSSADPKLTLQQKNVIIFNKALLHLHMNKLDQVREVLQQLQGDAQHHDDGLALIHASLLIKEKKNEEAEKLLKEYIAKHPESVQVPLSLAQIYLGKNEIQKALTVLGDVTSLQRKQGCVSTRASLFERLGDIDGAIKVLDTYVSGFSQKNAEEEDDLISALRISGEFKLKYKRYKEAYETFEKIIQKNPNDLKTLPQLIISASHFDPSLAEKYEKKIPMQMEEDVDVDALELLPPPKVTKQAASAENKDVQKTEKEKKKKKKKIRLPKNYDPKVKPDPERWLPKWQRSYFKKKQKKNQIGKGSQGMALTPPRPFD
eukprot:TRINITY_DN4023_c0_g2_i2.p1 TRINITY_DN4023_c0_g2~~TRINITY_DN4023_c0_g2_i2.p1  ORF type:complete len:623 (+),score=218.60 TRINITY_DN4023_c0_g2_i2:105-1973(+)